MWREYGDASLTLQLFVVMNVAGWKVHLLTLFSYCVLVLLAVSYCRVSSSVWRLQDSRVPSVRVPVPRAVQWRATQGQRDDGQCSMWNMPLLHRPTFKDVFKVIARWRRSTKHPSTTLCGHRGNTRPTGAIIQIDNLFIHYATKAAQQNTSIQTTYKSYKIKKTTKMHPMMP